MIVHVPPPEFIDTVEQAVELLHYLDRYEGPLGIDTETTGLNKHTDSIVMWSLATTDRRIALTRSLLPMFDLLFLDPSRRWVMTKAPFDLSMFANHRLAFTGEVWCTIVMDWLLYPEERRGMHGLKECCHNHLGLRMREFRDVFSLKRGEKTGDKILAMLADPGTASQAIDYASLDAYGSLKLSEFFEQKLSAVDCGGRSMWQLFLQDEVPFTKVLFDMERRGITIDTGYLDVLSTRISASMERLKKDFNREAQRMINLNSPPQLREFFFGELGARPAKKTKTGNSTDEETMEAIAQDPESPPLARDLARRLLEYRGVAKLQSTYVNGVLRRLSHDGRIRCNFNQAGTTTGRLSSSDPNLQNIPRDDDEFHIRNAFIAGAGKILLVFDYDQLEMKLLADMSGDENMISAINAGSDLHCFTASEMFPGEHTYARYYEAKERKDRKTVPLDDLDRILLKRRQNGKTIGFGLMYGQMAKGLSGQLGCSVREAEDRIERYFRVFPSIQRYREEVWSYARKHGYVTTLLGRRREVNILSTAFQARAEAERRAVNTTIQGTAADVCKKAMIYCARDPLLVENECLMLSQVHDEIIFELPDDPELIETCRGRIVELMEHPFRDKDGNMVALSVPLTVGGGKGHNWTEAKQ